MAVDPSKGANPIANVVNVDMDLPTDGGNAFVNRTLMETMPRGAGNVNKTNEDIQLKSLVDKEADNGYQPNLFSSWTDVYGAFIGSYKLVKGPKKLKRLFKAAMHTLFLNDTFTIMWLPDNNFQLGIANGKTKDIYGRIIEGSFTRWDMANGKPEDKEHCEITKENYKFFPTFYGNVFGIPPFLALSYYIKFRKFLWQFKSTNIRMNMLNKIIGAKDGAKDKLIAFLNDLFNMDEFSIPVPLKVIDVAVDDATGKITLNFVDLKDNQIDLAVDYKGNDINLDIEYLDKQIFRILGLRTDIAAKAGAYNERSNQQQSENAHSYFDYREEEMMKSWEDFADDIKEWLNIEIEVLPTYKAIQNEKEEKEIARQDKINKDSIQRDS